MRLRADFHIHTHYSADSSLTLRELIKRSREKRLDVIGVADHGTCKGAIDTKKLSKGNPLVIVGQEVTTERGDILVFRIKKDLEQMRPLEETCRKAKKMGGFIIAAHPFDSFRDGMGDSIRDVINYIDAIEGFNAHCLFERFNIKAQEFALEHDKPVVAGSDAHFSDDIGKAVNIIECSKSEKSVFDAIKKGNVFITGKRLGLRGTIVSKIRNELKKQ